MLHLHIECHYISYGVQLPIVLSTFSGIQAESTFRKELEPAGITVENYTFKTEGDPLEHIQELFVSLNFHYGMIRAIAWYALGHSELMD